MANFLLELAFEVLREKVPVVDRVTNYIISEGEKKTGDVERLFEKGYQHACNLSFDSLEKELIKRKNDNNRGPYTLGMVQRYKELKESED